MATTVAVPDDMLWDHSSVAGHRGMSASLPGPGPDGRATRSTGVTEGPAGGRARAVAIPMSAE
ncbi:hypothetical protein LUX05_15710 [Streptomyces somaliensis]|nr:hypothetical protein [Streptomyces somaliensis]